mgnify:CR=1 FL=1
MVLHSLTENSRVGNVGPRLDVAPSSKSSSKGNASSNTSGPIVNLRPINSNPDVPPVSDSEFPMVGELTSRTSARGVRLSVSPKSILTSLLVGLL